MNTNISPTTAKLASSKGFDNRIILDKWLRINNNICLQEYLINQIRDKQMIFIEHYMYVPDDGYGLFTYGVVVKEIIDYKVCILFEDKGFSTVEAALEIGIYNALEALPDINKK